MISNALKSFVRQMPKAPMSDTQLQQSADFKPIEPKQEEKLIDLDVGLVEGNMKGIPNLNFYL